MSVSANRSGQNNLINQNNPKNQRPDFAVEGEGTCFITEPSGGFGVRPDRKRGKF